MTGRPKRPRWLTADSEAEVMASVESGNTITTAAAAAGIDPADLYKWASEAVADDPAFAQFTAKLRTARAKAEQVMVQAVTEDAKGGFLVRRYTKIYPNGDEETDESFSPPNGRIGLEWLKARNGQQWGKPDMASDMLGEDASAGPGGAAQEAGTIEALAARLHQLMRANAEAEAPQDGPPAVAGQVIPPESGA
ncbi:MAG TPA: hypothetical protein VGG54_22920 [Trebonia sp.]